MIRIFLGGVGGSFAAVIIAGQYQDSKTLISILGATFGMLVAWIGILKEKVDELEKTRK